MTSAIYPRTPMNPCSEMCESLTSYMSRSAAAHNMSARSFLALLNDLGPTHIRNASDNLLNDDGRAINSYGSTQKQYLGTLVRLTGVTDLRHCTLGALGDTLASNGMGAVKKYRHWCEACFFDARRNETDAYDALIWQLPELNTCPLHSVELVDKCHKCGARQHAIPPAGGLDICIECGEPLGRPSDQCRRIGDDTVAGAYQHWLIGQLRELLMNRDTLRLTLTGAELRSFFQELRKTWDLPIRDLAARASLPPYSIETWASGRSQPKLQTLLRVCANLNVSPTGVLLDPVMAASQLPLDFELGNIYVPYRAAPYERRDREKIRAEVQSQLDNPTCTSIKQLAGKLGVPVGTLYACARDETMTFSAMLRKIRIKQKHRRIHVESKAARRAIKRLRSKALPLTRKNFVTELGRTTDYGIHRRKDIYARVMASERQASDTAHNSRSTDGLS